MFNRLFTAAKVIFALVVTGTAGNVAFACPQPPGYGFSIGYTFEMYVDGVLTVKAFTPGIGLRGDYERAYNSSTRGATYQYNVYTSGVPKGPSIATFGGAATPAYWDITATSGACKGHVLLDQGYFQASNIPVQIACINIVTGSVTFSPSPVTAGSPVSVEVSSANLSGTYGNASIEVYDPNGNLAFTQTSPVSGNSVNVTFDLAPASQGMYSAVLYNAQSDGSYTTPADAGEVRVNQSSCPTCAKY